MEAGVFRPSSVALEANAGGLRARGTQANRPRVHYSDTPPERHMGLLRQRLRVRQFQRRWDNIKEDLPPQLSSRHIGMISIGGVIGTGLFLGSGEALYNGGPIGALLGYFVIGTVVYCLCVSIGEMIAFLPNVGGVVGLADLYVDKALGFSLGWAAWYNWSVTLPAEITAAAILVKLWQPDVQVAAVSAGFLALATFINLFSSRVYGEFEFWFSATKVLTIVGIIISSLFVDFGVGNLPFIGFKNWKQPFADTYLGIPGNLGRFLGFWAVLMQASFSFFGSEVPGIAAGEVIDATRNVPRALQRVWIRITLFYLGGIFCAGLLVSVNDCSLHPTTKCCSAQPDLPACQSFQLASSGTSVYSSPFVIAFLNAGIPSVKNLINAAILLSAWSAAASDVYISSRFLFFLARCGHAPKIFASLIRYPSDPNQPEPPPEEEDILDQDDDDLPSVIDIRDESTPKEVYEDDHESLHDAAVDVSVHPVNDPQNTELHEASPTHSGDRPDMESNAPPMRKPWLVMPLYAVFGSASVGLLCFLDTTGGAEAAFNWLVSVTSVASLQSWAGMLFTYIRWYRGTVYAEKKNMPHVAYDEEARKVIRDIETIKIHRHKGQPYLAIYAFSVCMLILFTNGAFVFIHNGWRIADIPGEHLLQYTDDQKQPTPVAEFLAAYIPIPFFLLLTFGYKLIYQTKMIKYSEMSFDRKGVPPPVEDPVSRGIFGRITGWLLIR